MELTSNMTSLDIINLISSIASLILSILAIWLSLYFYNKSKNTETNVSENLSAIRAQTDTLQKLTARWMDRLTKHATDTTSYDTTLTQLIEVIKIIPTGSNLPQLQSKIEEMTQEAISGFIGMHYYCAVSNVLAQSQLPSTENFDPTSEAHNLTKTLLDNSHQTFFYLDDILNRVDISRIDASPIGTWFKTTEDFWKGSVKNATEVFQDNSSVL